MTRSNETKGVAMRLARATWLLGVIAKQMTRRPDGTAQVKLSARLVASLDAFLEDEAPRP